MVHICCYKECKSNLVKCPLCRKPYELPSHLDPNKIVISVSFGFRSNNTNMFEHILDILENGAVTGSPFGRQAHFFLPVDPIYCRQNFRVELEKSEFFIKRINEILSKDDVIPPELDPEAELERIFQDESSDMTQRAQKLFDTMDLQKAEKCRIAILQADFEYRQKNLAELKEEEVKKDLHEKYSKMEKEELLSKLVDLKIMAEELKEDFDYACSVIDFLT